MDIRHANIEDIADIARLESLCFPAAEAAPLSAISERVNIFPTHFWLGFENGVLLAFVNGMTTDEADLTDEMFGATSMHNENGCWQMLFGVCTHPAHQGKGLASAVLERVILDSERDKRKGVVLTCKEELIPFYARFGFFNEGVSKSEHGGAIWYQMRLVF